MSSSRQFVVYGPDARLRGAICDLAERSKRDAIRILGGRDEWQTPIVVHVEVPNFNRPGEPVAQLHVNQTGAGLKFQLELRISADVSVPEVERELLRAVLLETMYRSQPNIPPGALYVEPPEWLLDGMLALAPERDRASIAQALTTAAAGDLLTLEKFLQQKRALLDSPSQTLYRAYSTALVSLLIESPEGRAGLVRFVGYLHQSTNDPLADLTAHFASLGANAEQIEKNWRDGVVRAAGSEQFGPLNCEETERRLAQILRVKVPSEDKTTVYTLEESSQFRRNPAASADLRRLTTDLLLLSGRANPLYYSIIGEYQRIAERLLRRKTPDPRRLAELRAVREGLGRRMNDITDYLNWFEATQARVASGTFRDYLRAAEAASEPAPRRRDPISVYLDALEHQF